MQETWRTALIERLNSNEDLRDLVGARIYPAFLASITNPQFPCINFASEGGPKRIYYLPYSRLTIRFWAYSETNYEEAKNIFNLIEDEINGWVLTSEEATMVFTLLAEPTELFETELRGMTAAFVVRKI